MVMNSVSSGRHLLTLVMDRNGNNTGAFVTAEGKLQKRESNCDDAVSQQLWIDPHRSPFVVTRRATQLAATTCGILTYVLDRTGRNVPPGEKRL